MAPQCFEAIAGTSPDSRTVCRVHGCNIHVTLAPEAIYGNVDYYKDPKQDVGGSGFKSRHYDFIARHQDCGHTVPDYYASYGDKYIRRFTKELLPRLSPIGQKWLLNARKYLQKYIEWGFKQNISSKTITLQSYVFPLDTTLHLEFTTPEGKETLELDSEQFREYAFLTHPLAYADGGFHDMDISDYRKLMGQIDLREYRDLNTWKQMETIGWDGIRHHSGTYAVKIADGAWYEAKGAWTGFEDALDELTYW